MGISKSDLPVPLVCAAISALAVPALCLRSPDRLSQLPLSDRACRYLAMPTLRFHRPRAFTSPVRHLWLLAADGALLQLRGN